MSISSPVELPLDVNLHTDGHDAHPYVVVDVFTTKALEGNQLAVFTDARGFDAATMQRLARELNFAESVFVLPSERDGDVRIRIFTPRTELTFAGHPILGSAFIVATAVGAGTIKLEIKSGSVAVELERTNGEVTFGRFSRPAPAWQPYGPEAPLFDALGIEGSLLPVEAYVNGPAHVFVALKDEDAVAALRPDFSALGDLTQAGVNCFAGSGARWTTRMFAPAMGVPEDAATGSAAGALAMHLARHGQIRFGEEIEIHQGAQIGRPSVLFASAHGDANLVERVEVGGSAVVVAEGQYRVR
jgi:trans-2,3-dihydro-3-hydroxyanthranilate isomerase